MPVRTSAASSKISAITRGGRRGRARILRRIARVVGNGIFLGAGIGVGAHDLYECVQCMNECAKFDVQH